MEVTSHDGEETMTAIGRADDGAYASIVSSKTAKTAVLNGVGKLHKITPVKIQVSLKDCVKATDCMFSRSRNPPRTVFKLST